MLKHNGSIREFDVFAYDSHKTLLTISIISWFHRFQRIMNLF